MRSPGPSAFLILSLAVLGSGLVGCNKYDDLIEKDEIAQQRWSDYDAQLQRRHDLIPNLVATVKGGAAQEQKTLTAVMEARSRATSIHLSADDLQDPAKVAALQKAEGQLSGSLSRLLAVNESYPQLQSNEGFRDLRVSLEGTENRILRSREQYNEAAREYNTTLRQIGGSAVKRVTGSTFQPRVYITSDADAKAAPQVTF